MTLLLYLAPIWATLLAVVLLGERVGRGAWSRSCSGSRAPACCSAWALTCRCRARSATGSASAPALLFALSVTLVRKGEAIEGLEQTMVRSRPQRSVAGLLLLTPLPAAPVGPAVLAWAALAALAWLLPTTWLLLWGARFLEPGRVSLLLLFEVAVAALSAALLAGEPFGLREGLGCILILAAGALEGAAELRAARRTPSCLPSSAPTTVSDLKPLVD